MTVWFDGACPSCMREIALMCRLDRRGAIRFIDVASPDPVCPIDHCDLLDRFHARDNGAMLSSAEAFTGMWLSIGGGY